MSDDVLRCRSCGQANRVPPLGSGKKAICGKCGEPLAAASSGHPEQVTDASFRQFVSGDTPVVMDFWAPWCGPCHMVAPVLEALAGERRDVRFGKLNVDENPRSSAEYRVSGIPTLIFFRGGEEKGRIVGAAARPAIEQAIEQYLR